MTEKLLVLLPALWGSGHLSSLMWLLELFSFAFPSITQTVVACHQQARHTEQPKTLHIFLSCPKMALRLTQTTTVKVRTH